MAECLQISITGYGHIERDETNISMKRLESIAKVLNVEVKDILEYNDKHTIESLKKQILSKKDKEHYEEQIRLLEEVLQMAKDALTAEQLKRALPNSERELFKKKIVLLEELLQVTKDALSVEREKSKSYKKEYEEKIRSLKVLLRSKKD
jgi:transcriptional regulator with XRE-family HTH domain